MPGVGTGSMNIYYENDADPAELRGKSIAVLGFGNQGHAHALNLRDSGHRVLVAQRAGSRNHAAAVDHGFEPISIPEAVRTADLVIFALPDEQMGRLFAADVAPHLRPAQALGFIHGFAVHFRAVVPPPHVDVIMIAPKGPGPLVRSAFQRGGGLAAILAIHQDATGRARQLALAWGAGIGAGKGGMIEATFAQECETDLFGEQTVLCGGVIELMKAAFDVLVEAGYPPELSYLECMHELKQIVDMQYTGGLAAVRSRISNTASFGGLTRGPRLVTDATRREMREILREIQSGQFAAEWAEACRDAGRLSELEAAEGRHPSEAAGRRVREIVARAAAVSG